jgi:hypothetical protein
VKKLAVLFVIAAPVFGATINVFTALIPNNLGSPNYSAWRSNAFSAILSGATTAGTPGTPSYYQELTGVLPYQEVEVSSAPGGDGTPFPSWQGKADPGTAFGPAFANEVGERAGFPLYINGNGTQFSISQLSFTGVSSDPGNTLGFTFAVGSFTYSPDYVGILAGPDGRLGTADDVLITSGSNTQLVDALVGRGSGNALWPCGPTDPSPCSTIAQQQAAINNLTAVIAGATWTGTYTLSGTSANASVSATGQFVLSSAIPEPATGLLTLLTGAGIATLFRRRR